MTQRSARIRVHCDPARNALKLTTAPNCTRLSQLKHAVHRAEYGRARLRRVDMTATRRALAVVALLATATVLVGCDPIYSDSVEVSLGKSGRIAQVVSCEERDFSSVLVQRRNFADGSEWETLYSVDSSGRFGPGGLFPLLPAEDVSQ